MSRLIKRGTSVTGGIRPIVYGTETVAPARSDFHSPIKSDNKPEELKIAEEIKARAYKEALDRAEMDINVLLEEKTAELEAKFLCQIEEMQKEHAAKLSRLQEITSAIELQGKEYINNLEPFVVTLTMHALHKLTGKKEIFEELMRGIIAHAIGELAPNETIMVRLSEQDKQIFSIDGNPIVDKVEQIIFDDSLPSGGCMIESGNTRIDLSIFSALDGIQSALTSKMREETD